MENLAGDTAAICAYVTAFVINENSQEILLNSF